MQRLRYGLRGLIVLGLCLWAMPLRAQEGRPALVETASVQQQTIAQPVTFAATVEPRRRSLVASEVEGVVARVLVEEGQLVREGDTLVELRQERLQIALTQRQALAERYRQELAELENGTQPEEIEAARTAMLEAEAELERARREKQRQMELSARGVTSLQTRQDAETAAEAAQQRLLGARARYQLAVRGPRAERIAQAEAQLQAAQAEVARLHYDLRRSQVEAPFTGYVTTVHTEVGQWLRPGETVVELIEVGQVHITVPIPERYIAHVHLGDSGLVQFDALPGDTRQGEVIRVIPQATESRTFPVTIAIKNPDTQIKSGLFARVTLTVGEQQDALLVPKDAIVSQGSRDIVYTTRDDKATPIPIQRLSFYEGFAIVAGGLKAGEPVVVRGNERLRPGQPVHVVPKRPPG